MRTLVKPEGAARRAALGVITAGLTIGLAACGTTVAGTGTGAAASGPASRAPAAQPSVSGVNPGGVMVGAGPAMDTALCRAIPMLTRMTFMRSTRPPSQHLREVLPAGFTIKDRGTVRQLATLLCALPAVPPGEMTCPNDMGASYRMFFAASGRGFGEVTVDLSGCRVVTGLGPPRSWSTSTALEQALSQHFGIHFPLGP
jgi:F0F1-type ATP synthase membrane subunit c/vacuolar-type H+-ATPase subunit K